MPDSQPFLHDLIDVYFNDEELRALCFDMGGNYDYENLQGNTKRAKARGLVAQAMRRQELPLILTKLSRERPNVDWQDARLPPLPIYETPKGRRLLAAGGALLLLGIAALAYWFYFGPSRAWATYEEVPEEYLGIAVAEMGISADCRRGTAGREASALMYTALEGQINSVGLQRRVPLTKVGLVCNQEQAVTEGKRVAADIVVWGWVPQTAEGIQGQYAFVEPPEGLGAETLAQSMEVLVSGPALSRYYRLTGRTEALARFMLGLVYAKDEDYKSSLAMFDRAIQIVEEDEQSLTRDQSLAVLYTERGKTQSAMENPDLAFESYQTAEALNPDYIGLQIALGAYYYSLRDWDNAREYFDKANLQEEPLASIAYGYGLLDYYAGHYEDAIANFKLAVERDLALDKEPVLPWLALGYSYMLLGECDEATEAFQAIVNSESAETDIREAVELELSRCESTDLAPTPTILPTMVADAMGDDLDTVIIGPPPGSREVLELCPLETTWVRRGPSVSYPIIAILRQGESFFGQEDELSGWFQVVLPNGQHAGWVPSESAELCDRLSFWSTATRVRESELELTRQAFVQPLCIVSSTALREEAGYSFTIIATLPRGATVDLLRTDSGGWYQVRLSDGRTGWIPIQSAVRCEELTPTATATETAEATPKRTLPGSASRTPTPTPSPSAPPYSGNVTTPAPTPRPPTATLLPQPTATATSLPPTPTATATLLPITPIPTSPSLPTATATLLPNPPTLPPPTATATLLPKPTNTAMPPPTAIPTLLPITPSPPPTATYTPAP